MSQPSILVVDDDITIGESLVEGLGAYGHPARWSASLDDGLLESVLPRIVVLDLNMPGCDGFSAIERVAGLNRQPSLVIASGQGERVISAAVASARANGLGVLGALEKPYSILDLVRLVEARMGGAEIRSRPPEVPAGDLLWQQAQAFDLLYQPKVLTSTLSRVGYEALLRPRVEGLTAEAMFSANAPPDFQRAMTLAVIARALGESGVSSAGRARLPIAINCSPDVLAIDTISDDIIRAIDAAGASPLHLNIELTEQESLQPDHLITRALARLKMAGVKVILDDFGKGSTSLERIIRYPIDEVKIDKELLWAGMDDAHTLQIISDVVAFCRSKSISTTFEGIETENHLSVARQCMPDYCQGYFLGYPSPFEPPARLVEQRQ